MTTPSISSSPSLSSSPVSWEGSGNSARVTCETSVCNILPKPLPKTNGGLLASMKSVVLGNSWGGLALRLVVLTLLIVLTWFLYNKFVKKETTSNKTSTDGTVQVTEQVKQKDM